MRLRYVRNAKDICEARKDICIEDPTLYKGKWLESFNDNKGILSLEVGTGKGLFLNELSKANPSNLYIGLELMTSVICRAVQLVEKEETPNFKLINKDAFNLPLYFESHEVDKIYINFPDPWPKERHKKRRLTSPKFLELYKTILKEDGVIRFKTDNYPLYEYSLETMKEYLKDDFKYGESIYHEGDIMTEFETKYRAQGNKIYYIEGTFK